MSVASSLAEASRIEGFLAACLVESDSGLMLASHGGARLDLDLIAALNTEFVRAELAAIHEVAEGQRIQDILITLDDQLHLIRPLERERSVFVYVALDRARSNLGMARLQLKAIESGLEL